MIRNTGKGYAWSEAEEKALRKFHAAGQSAREIAISLFQLGYPVRSRCAILGRMQRMGISQAKQRRRPDGSKGLPACNNNPRKCQWPEGHPGDPSFRFCGKKPAPGRPYCAEHCARAYAKKEKNVA